MNEQQQSALDALGITMTCERIAARPDGLMSDPYITRHFQCELTRAGESMTVYFSQGSAHTQAPTAFDVLDCLASDWIGSDVDFWEWCDDLGFTPSRDTEQTYNAVQAQARDLSRLFSDMSAGDLYDLLRAIEEGIE